MPNNTLKAQNKILTKALKRIMRTYNKYPHPETMVEFMRKIARDAIREVEKIKNEKG